MKKLIAGNWKMNGSAKMARDLIEGIVRAVQVDAGLVEACDLAVCVPFPYLSGVQILLSGKEYIALGAQDCSAQESGAYTGEVSAAMLKDVGCRYVIVGHSERRQYHGETDVFIKAKAKLAIAAGLTPIICVGETESQRDDHVQEKIVGDQLRDCLPEHGTFVIAYEPVWAIGTGKTATPEDAAAMHEFIREKLKEQLEESEKVRILYGGSMKPENAAALLAMSNIDGGLIGGASLDAQSFVAIARAALKE